MVDKPEIIETQRFEDFRGWLSVSAEGFHVVQINQLLDSQSQVLHRLAFCSRSIMQGIGMYSGRQQKLKK